MGSIISLISLIWFYSNSARLIYMVATLITSVTCFLYLAFKKFYPSMIVGLELNQVVKNEKPLFIYSSSGFFILFTIQSFILLNRPDLYIRPVSYFLISCALAGIIGVEIAMIPMNSGRSKLVLMKILMLTISFTLSQQLLFHESLLGIDPWAYAAYSERMLESGTVLDGWAYSGLPLFDLELGMSQLITGLNYKFSSMISIGMIQTICDILFVYLIGRSIWNEKGGLFAALLIGLADQHLFLNWEPMATTMAATLLMMAVFLLIVKMDKGKAGHVFLLILSFTAVVLTHTVTALYLAIILLTFSIWPTMYRRGSGAPGHKESFSTITIACISIMLGWWIVGSGQFHRIISTIDNAFRFDFSGSTVPTNTYLSAVISHMDSLPVSELIFQRLGMFAFFAVALFGCLIVFSKVHYNPKRSSLAMSGLIALVIGFLPFTSATGIMHRWWYYAQLILAPFVGIALLTLTPSAKKASLKAAFTFIVVVTLIALSIFNPTANSDNPLVANELSHRYGLTHTEICGIMTLTNMAESTISTDQYYRMVIANNYYTYFDKTKVVDFSPGLISNDYTKSNYGLILIRDEIYGNSFLCYNQFYKLSYDPHISARDQGLNRVYKSHQIAAYHL